VKSGRERERASEECIGVKCERERVRWSKGESGELIVVERIGQKR